MKGKSLLVSLLLLVSPLSLATPEQDAAQRLLSSMNIEQLLKDTISQSLDAQIQANPQLAPLRGVMLEFMSKYMSYAALKDDLVNIYASAFTAAELNQIADFYQTPVGKKSVQQLPALMAKGSELGMQKVQQHLPELQQMIMQEMAAQQAPAQ